MLPILLALQVLTLLLVIVQWLRRPKAAAEIPVDPRLLALLGADVPTQLARTDARAERVEGALRHELATARQEIAEAAVRTQQAATQHAELLRRDLAVLGDALRLGLEGFRTDHRADGEQFRGLVDQHLVGLRQRFADFALESNKAHSDGREALHTRLADLARAQREDGDKIRSAVEARLDKLNEANSAKLEEMRATVDEKLHATLQTRLTESFGQVTDHLAKVHSGLGEMSKLSAGVDDLSRIFTNVKSRGGFAEVQLGMLLSQMLAPSQFAQNVKVKPNTGEMVEYAVKLPTPQGEVLLPIDAKFPREAWERLETAYEQGTPAEIAGAGKAFESAIRTEGKRICEKYIAPPATANFAVMFLPTEGLYAEVMRRDGLQTEIQQSCRVTIAGPSTLSALLSSFQMGFHMLDLQKKGDEVWKVLANARKEFGTFETLMGKMERQVGTVQNTIELLNTRTRAINRSLRDVSLEDAEASLSNGRANGTNGYEGLLPMLVANED